MNQITMTGDDWTSDRDRKAQAQAIAARKKTAQELTAQLEKSVAAMQKFINACSACGDPKVLNADDGRQRLREQMQEYATYLDTVTWTK
ncbi:hypothetical protein [Polaromonas naphthalenivorans]|uniref:Uncharacterized protein n=1 Tax=Polaromonas naphthalenivorans (strain CJ2) TaxID=365044 RepID=A1VSJ8_POLNA|nr:hypothetical protein [Polaromonas naphthalenivorans]ABM38626.1 hypothetical protein Pnap_3329 [Polaromonas naphthalenivorans CJ2]